ncbi:hypothetical protein SPHINGO8AM_30112 [Sphingomonas sp. 8AM]|nr:hypothetical protein SPHINGO8AM_30112 [Sphingomonas sp. 8AM]
MRGVGGNTGALFRFWGFALVWVDNALFDRHDPSEEHTPPFVAPDLIRGPASRRRK